MAVFLIQYLICKGKAQHTGLNQIQDFMDRHKNCK